MEADLVTLLIVCPLCFLAGVMNASGGSGGLISLPALLLAGLPPHLAIGTNKLQAVCGMAVANIRFMKSGYLNLKLAAPSVAVAMIGSFIGSNLSLASSEDVLLYLMFLVLPVAAFFVFKKDVFTEDAPDEFELNRKTYLRVCVSALVIGLYDGFYGPGTGTFLILAFVGIAHLSVRVAGAQAKAINFATNLTALVVFLIHGEVLIWLGLAAGVCNMIGCWIGAGLVIKSGARIMRPAIIIALVLLAAKVISGI